MSKASYSEADRIPTYEESIATSASQRSNAASEKSGHASPLTTVNKMMRIERTRRITHLVHDAIIPTFSQRVANGIDKLTILIIPSDHVPNASPSGYIDPYAAPKPPLSESNIVSPALPPASTTLLPLIGNDNLSSFWLQAPVCSELGRTLLGELTGSSTPHLIPEISEAKPSLGTPPPPPPPTPMVELPDRPKPKPWLKRTLPSLPRLPGPEVDPTGETGKWDLGWKPSTSSAAASTSTPSESDTWFTARSDEIGVLVRRCTVSLRTESELGLWETRTVGVVWVEIDVVA